MDNRVRPTTYEPPKSCAPAHNVGRNIKFMQRAVTPFSAAKQRVEQESPSLAPEKRAQRLICPDCVMPSRNQSTHERTVSHYVTTDHILTDSGNMFASPIRPFSGSSVMVPGLPKEALLTDPSIISENRATTTAGCEAVVDVARSGDSKTFTAEEATETLRKTTESLINSLKYDKISRKAYGPDQRDEVIGIFIDFILYQEGLVNDQCFTVRSSPDKYAAGETISQSRVEEIQSLLSDIFTERVAESRNYACNSRLRYSRLRYPRLRYSLGNMLADYLNKKENVPDDVPAKVTSLIRNTLALRDLLRDIYPFFETLFAGRGLFSELEIIFNFSVKFRQEISDSCTEFESINSPITIGLRSNKSNMREYFNRDVLDIIFLKRCDSIVNVLVDDYSLLTENATTTTNRLSLKFGEELEYDIISQNKDSDYSHPHVDISISRLREKGMSHYPPSNDNASPRYGFHNTFTVIPFYDTHQWLEINCTPYHSDHPHAELCFKKVIEVVDSMRSDGLIGYSSGHKHVDALSATQGDTGVLLAMESEIQRNPFLLRAFGNNDRIVQKNESAWYKTFADYASDTKPFAVKRLNWMIDRYNKKIKESCAEKLSAKGNTDSEKKDRLKEFAHFYSQFVHMTTIGFNASLDNHAEKYRAISLLHITGASEVEELSTLEFRFFRCPKTVQEIKLINQFLQAWFQYIHQCRKDKVPLEPVPEDIQSCKDYTAEQVQTKTKDYLEKLGLNPEDYRCFWGEVQDKT